MLKRSTPIKRSPLVRKAPDKATLTIKPRKAKCKHCGAAFERFDMRKTWCSPECGAQLAMNALDKARKAKAAEAKREDRDKLLKLQGRPYWLKRAQDAFNAWIRARDAGQPCISCGTHGAQAWHAGHYYSTAARPDLRLDPANVHRQCAQCNLFLSGNRIAYGANLPARIGQAEVDRLAGPPTAPRATVAVLQAIVAEYTAKLKALKAEHKTPSHNSGAQLGACAI